MLMLPRDVTAGEHSDPTVVDLELRFKAVKMTTPTKARLSVAQGVSVVIALPE
jgi:hypothetical protein